MVEKTTIYRCLIIGCYDILFVGVYQLTKMNYNYMEAMQLINMAESLIICVCVFLVRDLTVNMPFLHSTTNFILTSLGVRT